MLQWARQSAVCFYFHLLYKILLLFIQVGTWAEDIWSLSDLGRGRVNSRVIESRNKVGE